MISSFSSSFLCPSGVQSSSTTRTASQVHGLEDVTVPAGLAHIDLDDLKFSGPKSRGFAYAVWSVRPRTISCTTTLSGTIALIVTSSHFHPGGAVHFEHLLYFELQRRNGKPLSAERPIRETLLCSRQFKVGPRVRLTTSLSLSHLRFNAVTCTHFTADNRQSSASRYTDRYCGATSTLFRGDFYVSNEAVYAIAQVLDPDHFLSVQRLRYIRSAIRHGSPFLITLIKLGHVKEHSWLSTSCGDFIRIASLPDSGEDCPSHFDLYAISLRDLTQISLVHCLGKIAFICFLDMIIVGGCAIVEFLAMIYSRVPNSSQQCPCSLSSSSMSSQVQRLTAPPAPPGQGAPQLQVRHQDSQPSSPVPPRVGADPVPGPTFSMPRHVFHVLAQPCVPLVPFLVQKIEQDSALLNWC